MEYFTLSNGVRMPATRFYNPPADMEEKYAFLAIDLDSQP